VTASSSSHADAVPRHRPRSSGRLPLDANVVEVARPAGHSPAVTLSAYAHLFDEAAGVEHTPAEVQIRRARQIVREERRTDPYPKSRPR
jgi:hypothetical protein